MFEHNQVQVYILKKCDLRLILKSSSSVQNTFIGITN